MNYEHYTFLRVQCQGPVAVVTMSRPDQRNAPAARGLRELEQIWRDLAVDPEVLAIVLTGAGPAFSAGGDLQAMAEKFGTQAAWRETLDLPASGRRLLQNILEVPQPLVAAVNGDAIGLGATLALFADLSVIAEDAKFGDTHVKVGLVAGDGGTVIWPLLIGANRAKEFLMRGRLASGTECCRLGLINHAVPRDQVLSKAIELAQEMAAGASWAVRWTKMSINRTIQQQMNLLLDASLALEMMTMQTKDHREAVQAFLERRVPRFEGR